MLRQIGAEQGLPSKLFECSQQDREGNLWLGFSGSGLPGVRPRVFNTVRPMEKLSDRAVRSVCEDADGAVWLGSSANNAFRWKDGALSAQTLPTEQVTGSGITVCPDNEGRLWIGSVLNGAWILQSNQLTRPFTSKEITGPLLMYACCDKNPSTTCASDNLRTEFSGRGPTLT